MIFLTKSAGTQRCRRCEHRRGRVPACLRGSRDSTHHQLGIIDEEEEREGKERGNLLVIPRTSWQPYLMLLPFLSPPVHSCVMILRKTPTFEKAISGEANPASQSRREHWPAGSTQLTASLPLPQVTGVSGTFQGRFVLFYISITSPVIRMPLWVSPLAGGLISMDSLWVGHLMASAYIVIRSIMMIMMMILIFSKGRWWSGTSG